MRCWHAKTDGWAASTFHSICDGKGPTVTIVQVGRYIFGGYTDKSWGGMYQVHICWLHLTWPVSDYFMTILIAHSLWYGEGTVYRSLANISTLQSICDGEGLIVTIVYEKSLITCISKYIKDLDSTWMLCFYKGLNTKASSVDHD